MARAVYVTCYYKLASSEARRSDCGQGVRPKQFALGAANMTELPPQLRQVRDFFFKQALALSPERTHIHHPELIKNQTIFRLEDLRKHLNNPSWIWTSCRSSTAVNWSTCAPRVASRSCNVVRSNSSTGLSYRSIWKTELPACSRASTSSSRRSTCSLPAWTGRIRARSAMQWCSFHSAAAKRIEGISIPMTCSQFISRGQKSGACTDANL